MKKKVKKKRIKLKNLVIALLIIIVLGGLVYLYLNSKIRNIYVIGNNYFHEQDIIEIAGLKDYPKFKKINKRKIKEKLLNEELINDVKVSLSLDLKLTIEIKENKALCYSDNDNKIILSDGTKIDNKYDFVGMPILSKIESIEDQRQFEEVYDRFIKAFNKVNLDVLNKISEINYKPSNLDKDRFLLYMNDQIYVYITLTKIDVLNNYNEITESLEGKKGILYLDSGNHFEIIEEKVEEEKIIESNA
jgi:cell division septal protein FtsQ